MQSKFLVEEKWQMTEMTIWFSSIAATIAYLDRLKHYNTAVIVRTSHIQSRIAALYKTNDINGLVLLADALLSNNLVSFYYDILPMFSTKRTANIKFVKHNSTNFMDETIRAYTRRVKDC